MLPILHRLLEDGFEANGGPDMIDPEVVVISPTRELAIQIKDEARKFAQGSGIRCFVIYGGTQVLYQIDQVRQGVNVLVATPGRLADFVNRGVISFQKVKFLVLDEGDRMLDMGFLGDIQAIINHTSMPPRHLRQTLMFSATFPEEIQKIALEYLNNYLFLIVGTVGGACSDVTQSFFQVKNSFASFGVSTLISIL